jgi:hypothetical protein
MTGIITPPTFSGDASPTTGPAVPTAREVQVIGVIGRDMDRLGRVTLMNQIGRFLGIPPGGWHNQAKLFDGDDVRLAGLLDNLIDERTAALIAGNLEHAARYVHGNVMMTLVTAHREGHKSLTATGTKLIDTYDDGGLDFLESEKKRLGLPHAIIDTWKPVGEFTSLESKAKKKVNPEQIPARDQVLAYAATIASRFAHHFKAALRHEFGKDAESALGGASRMSLLVWQAYTFLAPGGNPYNHRKKLSHQIGQRFGQGSALGYFAHKAKQEKRSPSLDDILTDHALDHLEWLHSAKTRAAETLFMERLQKRARELLPH